MRKIIDLKVLRNFYINYVIDININGYFIFLIIIIILEDWVWRDEVQECSRCEGLLPKTG